MDLGLNRFRNDRQYKDYLKGSLLYLAIERPFYEILNVIKYRRNTHVWLGGWLSEILAVKTCPFFFLDFVLF